MATSKCDIIRDMAAAVGCGMCRSETPPAGCRRIPPAAVCRIPATANIRMKLFDATYSPSSPFASPIDKLVDSQIRTNYATNIAATEAALAAAYPGAAAGAAAIGWPDVEKCLWNADGFPGGPSNNTYFTRADAMLLGMDPEYPVGGGAAAGKVWKNPNTNPIPLTVDYLMNPDLFTILVFALLVLVFAAVVVAKIAAAAKKGRPPRAYPAPDSS